MEEAEGIPPTASVASVGPGINYIGQHIYAYNTTTITTTPTVLLAFTTGAGYIVARIFLYGGVSFDSVSELASGDTSGLKIKLNEVIIGFIKTDSGQEDMAIPAYYDVILPPFTKVECEFMSVSTQSAYLAAVSITGRVYDV